MKIKLRGTELGDKLKECNAELVRSKRHLIYRLPNGATLVVSKSPSDKRAMQNVLKELARLLENGPTRR